MSLSAFVFEFRSSKVLAIFLEQLIRGNTLIFARGYLLLAALFVVLLSSKFNPCTNDLHCCN